MKRILFICPYFGVLPKQHMELWLQSCEMNPNIDWLILTDDRTKYNYPGNVKVEYYSFLEMKEYIQRKFEFKISLEAPYKLCDFKPTYGYIFSEYLVGYDYWGHCDMSDCIFGDLRKFLDEFILSLNDKIGFLGHMTLYRNTDEVNKRFMLITKSGIQLRDILGVSENKAFDELTSYSINTIYNEYNFQSTRFDEMYVDISPIRFAFQASSYNEKYLHVYKKKVPMIFEWSSGCLFEYKIVDEIVVKREIGYVHFQKRKMIKDFDGIKNRYFIVPNKFLSEFDVNDLDKIVSYSRDKLYLMYFKQKWEALKYHIKHFIKNKKG